MPCCCRPSPSPAELSSWKVWTAAQEKELLELAREHTRVGGGWLVGQVGEQGVRLCAQSGEEGRRMKLLIVVLDMLFLVASCAPQSPPHTAQEDGGIKWAKVATHFPGRTDKQCSARWRSITSG